jgi:glycosyltransferase involved in cell wall biosynthesis
MDRDFVTLRPGQGAPKRIGYLVGRFPNAAHAYFWREVSELRRSGILVDFCSTIHPGPQTATHAWATTASAETRYLIPMSARDVAGVCATLLAAGPQRWLRSLRSIWRAADVSFIEKVKMLRFVVLGARLLQVARREGWEHVHSGFCNDTANIAVHARLLGDLPYSTTLHGPLETFGPNQKEKWGNAAFGTVLFQRALTDIRQALGEHLPPRLEVAPMGIVVEKFVRKTPYVPWDGKGQARIFCCARIEPGKGTVDLVKALGAVRASGIDAHLTLAGEAFPRIEWFLTLLEKTIDELQLRPHITRVKLSEEGVRDTLEQSHVMTLASYHEGVPVAAMEAMAMEVPVVATTVGGVPDLIRTGVDGLLVPSGQPETLGATLASLLRDPEQALRYSRAGRPRVVQSFHVGRNASVMASCLGWVPASDDQKVA